MGPTKSQEPAQLDELIKKGRGAGGPAAEALRKAAHVLRERGDPLGAVELYMQASERAAQGPTEPKLHSQVELELGQVYENDLGRLDQAMERYQRAFKLDKTSTVAIEAGRRIYQALGDWPQVVRLYEVEIEVGVQRERRADILVALGTLLSERLADPAAAAEKLEEALRIKPGDERAAELLASLYVSPDFPAAPDDDAAQLRLDRAAQLYVGLADQRQKRGDHAGEVAFLRRALGADPYHVNAATRLEHAYAETNRVDELRRLYRGDAPVPNRSLKRAQLALDAGDLNEAIEATVAAYADGEDAHECAARVEKLLDEKKDALGHARFRERLVGASTVDGAERAQHLIALAALHQKTGAEGQPRAEAALREALAVDPTNEDAFHRLMDLLTARRDYASVIDIAEGAVADAALEDQPRRLAELADIYEKKVGDVAAATDAWLRAEAIEATPRGALELKRLHQKQARWDSLIAAIEREMAGAATPAARADALKRLAQVYRERHDLERAAQLLEEAIELRNDDGTLYRALADLHEHEGRIDLVAKTLRRQLRVAKEKVERLNLLRRLALLYDERLDDADGVQWACEEILSQLPGDRDALRRLEAAYERAGADAEEPLVATLEKHAQAAATPAERLPVLHRLAALLEKRGDLAGAAERLEKILKLDKSDARAQDAAARIYESLDRPADAALALERVLQRTPAGPEGADAWKRFARLVDGKLNDPLRGLKAWREVLERRPTDREALEAVAKLARARGDAKLLDEVLERRQQHAGPDEAAALALERAALAEERLKDPQRAMELLRKILRDLAPRDVEAHARLRRLEKLSGNLDASLRVAERELFLQPDAARKLEVAVEIARAWRDMGNDARRAISAWTRVLGMDGAHWEALSALAALHAQVGEWPRVMELDEKRLALAEERNDAAEKTGLLFELALAAEKQLKDPKRAFEYLKRAHALDGAAGTLGELRRVAEAHNLWEDLCAIYAAQPGLDARLQVAAIADERLRDPKRAFAVVRGALDLDPDGTELLGELERLSVRAADPDGLLEVYERLLARREDDGERVELLSRRAEVLEKRLRDPNRALDELMRAFPLAPDDEQLLGEIRRLAEATSRWEDVLAVYGQRFHRARPDWRLPIALEAARVVEDKVKDSLRAFRAYLRALQLAPDDDHIREQLWRLARAIGEITPASEKPAPAPRPIAPLPDRETMPAGGGPVPAAMDTHETTMEIGLEDMDVVEEPKPARKPRRDATVELSIEDLVSPRGPGATIDLSLSDVQQPRKPPPLPGARRPPPTPGLRPPPPVMSSVPAPSSAPPAPASRLAAIPMPQLAPNHNAWDELALVLLHLPVANDDERLKRLLAVSDMWERGAQNVDRAFSVLADAFLLDPEHQGVRDALEQLAERSGAWDTLVEVLDDAIEQTGSADQAVRLLLDAATIRERQGKAADAQERLHRVLGMRPDCQPALVRLEETYRAAGRWSELSTLLERRMGGLVERMAPGDHRHERAIELATVYEKTGQTYEAIGAWKRVADERPDYAPAFASLARLYESVGQWSRVIEALTRELDLAAATGAHQRARELRRRVGEIFEKELELPDRAIEAYEALLEDDTRADEAADAALERLYERHGRYDRLDALIARRTQRTSDAEARATLLARRATLLESKLNDPGQAAVVLRQLRRLRPDDDALVRRLIDALGAAGRADEQLELLRERAQSAARRGVSKPERVALYVEIARLETNLGDIAAAQKTLEKALELEPGDPTVLAELARVREGGSDWDGYAAAREREAEVAQTPEHAARALLDAARVHEEKRNDLKAARRDLERALDRDPMCVPALQALHALTRRLGDHAAADALAERELALEGVEPARRADLTSALGASAIARGDIEVAGRWFREAIAAAPGHAPAVNGLCDVAARAGAWDEVEALARDAFGRGGPADVQAQMARRLADALEHQGKDDDAYTALLDADRALPGDLRTRLRLGENRYRANRFREAAQYLGALAAELENPKLAEIAVEAGEALYHAALSEIRLRRPERVGPLLDAAVRIHPRHAAALGMLAERAIEAGDLPRAVGLLEQQAAATTDARERTVKEERLGDVILQELKDPARACAAYQRAVDAAGAGASDALLDKALRLERESGQLERAARSLVSLLERDAPPDVRARRLREAASLDAALGRTGDAKARLRAALEIQPLDHDALGGLSAMLVGEGADDEAAALLTRALAHLPPPAEDARAARATLWMRLAECRERLRDPRGGLAALEKALEADPGRRALREALLARYGDDPAHDAGARTHHLLLLREDPLYVPSLRAMTRLEARANAPDGGRRFLELLAVAGALTDEERQKLAAAPAARTDDELPGALEESDHERLAHPDALGLAPVFAALWEGTAADRLGRAPDLAALGVGADDRVSPVMDSDLARAYSLCSRALGNRKTGLYLKATYDGVAIVAKPPTAIVVGASLTHGRALADVRFVLGRALEIARPEYVLAAGLDREAFTKLFAAILRAFHPRHSRRRLDTTDERDDDAAMWKRALPYKVARRLADLFTALADTEFSTATWRRAVQNTANRAGLLASGDMVAAARVLNAEGDAEGVRELAKFAGSDDYVALRAKLLKN
jgi:tetratricopeptide (TPR) repeat protein